MNEIPIPHIITLYEDELRKLQSIGKTNEMTEKTLDWINQAKEQIAEAKRQFGKMPNRNKTSHTEIEQAIGQILTHIEEINNTIREILESARVQIFQSTQPVKPVGPPIISRGSATHLRKRRVVEA